MSRFIYALNAEVHWVCPKCGQENWFRYNSGAKFPSHTQICWMCKTKFFIYWGVLVEDDEDREE